jgi:type I restriction enzyme S subunit
LTNIGLTYKPSDVCADGVPVLRSNNIRNGKLDFTDTVKVNTSFGENLELQESDILICTRNGSRHLVGKCALIPASAERMTFGAFMAVFRSTCSQYVYHFLNSDFFRLVFDSEGISTQINQLTQAMIKDTLIPLPPMPEQLRIVSALDSAMSVIDEIDDYKTDLRSSVVAAKSKILSLAVSGKLVPQDPADEPASVLLERIRAEREVLVKAGKIKRSKGANAQPRTRDNS